MLWLGSSEVVVVGAASKLCGDSAVIAVRRSSRSQIKFRGCTSEPGIHRGISRLQRTAHS
jgi:hypothetical protein